MTSGNSQLPEYCIGCILAFTSPRTACQLSTVSSTFKSAADSDLVWEGFLPPDYKTLLSQLVSDPRFTKFSCKKELFLRLCGWPIFLQGGNKVLKLEKHSGKTCLMIGAKELTFACCPSHYNWTSRYQSRILPCLNWTSRYHSRFDELVELIGACSFEICLKMETQFISSKTTYVAYLVFKVTGKAPGNGVDNLCVEVYVKLVSGGRLVCSGNHRVYLATPGRCSIDMEYVRFPKKRRDGWMEFEMGEFYNEQGGAGELEMSLKKVEGLHYKYGVLVQGIELRPKINA